MRGTIDGNEAAVDVAYRLTELCAIYPITPSSTMAELADDWASARRTNIWGTVPTIMEMQSEAGAAGAMHGALQGGAMSTTYTASQGLLLMIPNMYKIAGELTATVFQVAARSLAAQGLSIFGDHSDVMAVRQTGFALLSSASVQEAHDFALIAQAATLRSRVPFLHFFDGFRTSHEVTTMERLEDDDLRALVPDDLVREHRLRALTPERPFIRGTAQNPDVYFQARETVNPYYARVAGIVQEAMDALAERTGRAYRLVEYAGHPEATRVIVVMGSGGVTARETVTSLAAAGEKVGVLQVRLYRPFPAAELVAALPRTVEWIAVLDRTKEPGSMGEPLFLDVVTSLSEAHASGQLARMPRLIGGRYGLSSKEFTPGMVAGIFAELAAESPRPRFTIGINDDVSGMSLPYDPDLDIEDPATLRALFYGIGSDGTVGANKNTVKILAEDPQVHAQAYFVYDSKKSGGLTVSHLRFGPVPIAAPWLVTKAGFVGIHDFTLLDKVDILPTAQDGATLLLNSPHPADQVWDSLPGPVQQEIIDRRLRLFAIDADAVAREAGLPGRTNTVLQACFFAISGVLPREEALERVKATIRKTYGRRGQEVVRRNETAVDSAAAAMAEIPVPAAAGYGARHPPGRPGHRARVRPHGDRRDDGGPRRVPAGQRHAGGRHLPERHDDVREAPDLRVRRRVGPGHVHPVRQLHLRLPAQRHPGQVRRRCRARGRTGGLLDAAAQRGRPADGGVPAAGLRRRLHRLRPVRGGLPGESHRPTPPARRSTSSRSSPSWRPSGATSSSSRRCRSTTVPGSTSGPSAAPSSSSRSSSSPAPAPAVARRPTSSS